MDPENFFVKSAISIVVGKGICVAHLGGFAAEKGGALEVFDRYLTL